MLRKLLARKSAELQLRNTLNRISRIIDACNASPLGEQEGKAIAAHVRALRTDVIGPVTILQILSIVVKPVLDRIEDDHPAKRVLTDMVGWSDIGSADDPERFSDEEVFYIAQKAIAKVTAPKPPVDQLEDRFASWLGRRAR